jgi:VanZ family protein
MTKLFQILFILCLLSIEYLSTTTILTTTSIPVVENSWDKLNHFAAFFVLYILFNYGYKIFTTLGKVTLLFLFALQIEIVQYFIPNRYFSLLDLLVNGAGVLIAIAVIGFYTKYIKVKDTEYHKI